MDKTTEKLGEVLASHGRFPTKPVAVKLAKPGEVAPGKVKYPLKHVGNPLAVCQGMTIARTYGWSMAFGKEDHGCPLPRIFMGHNTPDTFLEGGIAAYYQDDDACRKAMEASYPRWPMDTYGGIWLSPIDKCGFKPDVVVVYGTPAQILALIQGANYGHGPGIQSTSTGRYGCSAWIAGVIQADQCTYMVPGPGERIFAGTQDHEMSFAVPYSQFDRLMDGLNYVRSQRVYGYPVPNLAILSAPRIPGKYHEIIKD